MLKMGIFGHNKSRECLSVQTLALQHKCFMTTNKMVKLPTKSVGGKRKVITNLYSHVPQYPMSIIFRVSSLTSDRTTLHCDARRPAETSPSKIYTVLRSLTRTETSHLLYLYYARRDGLPGVVSYPPSTEGPSTSPPSTDGSDGRMGQRQCWKGQEGSLVGSRSVLTFNGRFSYEPGKFHTLNLVKKKKRSTRKVRGRSVLRPLILGKRKGELNQLRYRTRLTDNTSGSQHRPCIIHE